MKIALTTAVVLGFSGGVFAAGGDFAAVEKMRADDIGRTELSVPSPSAEKDRWWSVDIAGSGHKAVMAAALKFIDRAELPDMVLARAILLPASNDESGHPDPKANGGKVEELWHGKTPFSKGGVLWNYEHFKFPEAYARLGTICHLTQDQSVPTHAANVAHYTSDSFEGYAAEGNKVKIAASRDNGDMEPYAYYQDLQDDTRSHLSSWVNPQTGIPYWVQAPDAPPLGQDATYGPWGSYGGGRDSYSVRDNNNGESGGSQQVTASPEIRIRQLAMAGAATVGLLKSASKRLPPLVSGLSVTAGERRLTLKFTVFDNRSGKAGYTVSVFREGVLQGAPVTGEVSLASQELVLSGEVNDALDTSSLPAGDYVLDVRVTDLDGNVTPDEVNDDDIPANDTKAVFKVN